MSYNKRNMIHIAKRITTERMSRNGKQCTYCSLGMIPKVKSISVHHSDQKLEIDQNILCDQKNVIYIAECKQCNMQSIGSTTQKFKDRVKQYKSNLRKKVTNSSNNMTIRK